MSIFSVALTAACINISDAANQSTSSLLVLSVGMPGSFDAGVWFRCIQVRFYPVQWHLMNSSFFHLAISAGDRFIILVRLILSRTSPFWFHLNIRNTFPSLVMVKGSICRGAAVLETEDGGVTASTSRWLLFGGQDKECQQQKCHIAHGSQRRHWYSSVVS